jgi:hypothetical protein
MRVLVLLCALAMPVVAFFSQRGAFGPDNGTLSDRYPTLLVASGYAFSIWGLIFLWDAVYGAWQLFSQQGAHPSLQRVRRLTAAGFALTAAWMPVFSMRHFWIALAIIWAALICLANAAIILSGDERMPAAKRWLAWAPVSLHAGWLGVAAFLNTAQVVVAYDLLPSVAMLTWSLVLFALAAALLLALNARMYGNAPFVAAAFWGLVGVYVKQSAAPLPGADVAAWVALAIAVVLVVDAAWRRVRFGRRSARLA